MDSTNRDHTEWSYWPSHPVKRGMVIASGIWLELLMIAALLSYVSSFGFESLYLNGELSGQAVANFLNRTLVYGFLVTVPYAIAMAVLSLLLAVIRD